MYRVQLRNLEIATATAFPGVLLVAMHFLHL